MGSKSINHLKEEPIVFYRDYTNDIHSTDQMKTKVSISFKLLKTELTTKYSLEIILNNKPNEQRLGETDLIESINGKIKYSNSYMIDYYFEKEQPLIINITRHPMNSPSKILQIKTSLASIVGSRKNTFLKKYDDSSEETIKIKATEIKDSTDYILFDFKVTPQGNMQDKHNRFFYIISSSTKLYQSEALPHNGIFKPMMIPMNLFTQKGVMIDFKNYKNNSVRGYTFTLEEFISGKAPLMVAFTENCHNIINGSKKKQKFTFIDYLKGGVQLGLTLGIDYTLSNLLPTDPKSLHHINQQYPNYYQRAIRSCGDIIAYYDYDQLFPVYGFGGKLPNTNKVSMCFHVNMTEDPNAFTINQVLDVYQNSLKFIELSGPTFFAPLINQCILNIRNSTNPLAYHILMILTDGMINDMDLTIDALVEGSFLPLSVVIVGIGSADFTNMQELDGDDHPLISSKNVKCARDIVQFVPFSKYENNGPRLAEEVLAEIPRQVVDYYHMNNMSPNQMNS